ncbi:MAG: hypothetical protein IJ911_09725 [Salinivirgaceae bacterium]|nr:hypothetical protein [Salinivirgaceae bacterium]
MNGIPIQYLDGVGNVAKQAYNQQSATADKVRRRKFHKWQLETPEQIRRRQASVQYYTRGMDDKTVRNIGYISKGLDFVGYHGDGSVEDQEMIYNHLLRTKQVVDSAPQAVAVYQNPQQLSDMLGYVLDNWDSANREKAIENMAREESRLIDEGKIVLGDDSSDAHFLAAGENYDPDTQRVLMNGAVETLPNRRGLFNRLKKTSAFANVASKDAEVLGDLPFTRKLRATIRQNVAANRKNTTKNIRETKIKNGYVHNKVKKIPVYTVVKSTVSGLDGVDDDLQFLLMGIDFAYNADEGLTVAENIDNYRRYFARLSAAIAAQPLTFYDSFTEAAAVRRMLAQIIPAIGNEAAMDALCAEYESGVHGIDGLDGLGELNGKLKKALKKATKAVSNAAKSTVKAVAQTTTNAAKSVANAAKTAATTTAKATTSVAKAAANTTKAAVKATGGAVKQVAKTTANVTKAAAKTTANAAKSVANATKDVAKTAVKTTANVAKTAAKSTANAAKSVANATKNVATTATKAAVKTTTAAVKSAVNATKATANVVKAGVQAATGNKEAAKETLKKAGEQAKSAVTQPAKAVATAVKDTAKTAVSTTKDLVKNTIVEPTKSAAKTAVQATKDVAKTAVSTTKDLVKNTVVEPTKTVVKTAVKETKDLVKNTVIEPTKTVAKATAQSAKDVVKNAIVEPTKAAVKTTVDLTKKTVVEPTKVAVNETIVKPTKFAIKLTKKVTKVALKMTKKLVAAVLLYNPITLLIKGGLLVAFRLNMFKMSSRSYLGSMSEEEAISNYGITPEEYQAQKESFDKIYKICCGTFKMKESKLLDALKKGFNRKWEGSAEPQSEDEIKAAGNAAEADDEVVEELQAQMEADIAADKKELEAKGAKASDKATKEAATETQPEHYVVIPENKRTTKVATVMYEQGGDSSKKIADLPKGTALYVSTDKAETDGTWIAATTTDDKHSGYVKIADLDEITTTDGQPVAVISGLCNNGYDSISGLGEAATIGASIAAAASWILNICLKLKDIWGKVKDVLTFGKEMKETFSPEDEGGEEEEPDNSEESMPESPNPQNNGSSSNNGGNSNGGGYDNGGYPQMYPNAGQQQAPAESTAKPKEQAEGGINKKLIIGATAAVVGLAVLAIATSRRNNVVVTTPQNN